MGVSARWDVVPEGPPVLASGILHHAPAPGPSPGTLPCRRTPEFLAPGVATGIFPAAGAAVASPTLTGEGLRARHPQRQDPAPQCSPRPALPGSLAVLQLGG